MSSPEGLQSLQSLQSLPHPTPLPDHRILLLFLLTLTALVALATSFLCITGAAHHA